MVSIGLFSPEKSTANSQMFLVLNLPTPPLKGSEWLLVFWVRNADKHFFGFQNVQSLGPSVQLQYIIAIYMKEMGETKKV